MNENTSKLSKLALRAQQKAEQRPTESQSQAGPGKLRSVGLLERLSSSNKHIQINSHKVQDPSSLDQTQPISSKTDNVAKPLITSTTSSVKQHTLQYPQMHDPGTKCTLDKTPSVLAETFCRNPSHFSDFFCYYKKISSESLEYLSKLSYLAQIYLPNASTVPFSNIAQAFSSPSPDDVVLQAQSQASFGKREEIKTPSPSQNQKTSQLLAKLSLNSRKVSDDDVLNQLKSSNYKSPVAFVVIGHVDAGKSTLVGRLLLDLGVLANHKYQKNVKESQVIGKGSFALAWALDETADERQHGVTIDVATKSFETTSTSFTVLDAPGHRDFVPNMIAGSSRADLAVLVVDAGTNAFEAGLSMDGQTKEHALLIKSLGVNSLVVAVNKLDSVKWSEQRFTEIRTQLEVFLSSVGYKRENLSFVPTSGLNGENVATKSSVDSLTKWYTGPSLLQQLELSSTDIKQRNYRAPFRMVISDVQVQSKSNSLTMHGKVDSGIVKQGQPVMVLPSKRLAEVRAIVKDSPSEWAVAGESVALDVNMIETTSSDSVLVGDVLCTPDNPLRASARFRARVLVFQISRPLLSGSKFAVYRGNVEVPGKLVAIVATLSKSDGSVVVKKQRHLTSNQTAEIEIELEKAIVLEEFVNSKELGRIILRSNGTSIAAGVIEKIVEHSGDN